MESTLKRDRFGYGGMIQENTTARRSISGTPPPAVVKTRAVIEWKCAGTGPCSGRTDPGSSKRPARMNPEQAAFTLRE